MDLMAKLNEQTVLKVSLKDLSEPIFKRKIFCGDIIIIEKCYEIFEIINMTERYFSSSFNVTLNDFTNGKLKSNITNDKLFLILQKRIKNCKLIKKKFSSLVSKIGLNTSSTFMDKITIRFSPKSGDKTIGNLSPTEAHRDTWASNITNQINFWFPLHNVTKKNSIFFVPYYFARKIPNNSKTWSFSLYKKKKDYPSVPTTKKEIKDKDMVRFKLSKGQVICFSGHHLHGSMVGTKERINLETRTVSSNDDEQYSVPRNVDSESRVIKKKWFKNLETEENFF